MSEFFNLAEIGQMWHLAAETGDAPSRSAIEAAGEYPAGDFWGSVVEYLLATNLNVDRDVIEIDPDAQGLFIYSTEREALEQIKVRLDMLATDPNAMTELINAATASGFIFD